MTWVTEEVRWLKFPDARLNKRFGVLLEKLTARPTVSVPEACGSWAATKAAYRFWSSARVSAQEIRRAHIQATTERLADHEIVLAIQDTTVLDFSNHKTMTGLGPIGPVYLRGLLVHSTLAVSRQGTPMGLLDQLVWSRDDERIGQSKERRKRPTAQKESGRWLTSLAAVQQVVADTKQVVVIADREADIYDLFTAARRPGVELLIRAEYNRRVWEEAGHLLDAVEATPVRARWTVEVARSKDRLPRKAKMSVRWTTVTVRPPHRGDSPDTSSVVLNALLVMEQAPPAGVPPLRWLLLTTLPIAAREDARCIVRWYALRWLIERYHFVLKSGCHVEQLQLETAQGLEKALATYCIVAWRLLWITYEARNAPQTPCTRVSHCARIG